MEIFGEDYDTANGTCFCEFIHVSDLAQAHVNALDHLGSGRESLSLNCGYGHGYSVREVIEALQRAAGTTFPVRIAPRRPGDVRAVISDVSPLRAAFDWQPAPDSLDELLRPALPRQRTCPSGARGRDA